MPEDTKVVAADNNAAPKEENKQPALDKNRPLSQQVNKILDLMPKDESEDKPKEEPKEETEAEPKEEAPKEEEQSAPNEPEGEEPEAEKESKEPVVLPTWQKYILDNLPEIKTVGHVPGKKDKAYTFKRPDDLPEDFEFADKRTEMAFTAALASQEVNARELLNRYNQEQQQQQYQQMKNQEALDVQADIKRLQKEGLLDKFKYAETDSRFNDDPTVKIANDIYDLYEKTNNEYVKRGVAYRISYADAADKYFARQARQKPAQKTPERNENQQERQKVASKVSAPSSAEPGAGKKGLPPGTTMQDVLKLYKLGRI